jgi:hypothetical protein
MQAKELAKDVERKKREKLEDARAKAAIEADKRERAAKAAAEKAAREGAASGATAAAAEPAVVDKPAAAVKSSENPQTRLQVRVQGGKALMRTFASDASECVGVLGSRAGGPKAGIDTRWRGVVRGRRGAMRCRASRESAVAEWQTHAAGTSLKEAGGNTDGSCSRGAGEGGVSAEVGPSRRWASGWDSTSHRERMRASVEAS